MDAVADGPDARNVTRERRRVTSELSQAGHATPAAGLAMYFSNSRLQREQRYS